MALRSERRTIAMGNIESGMMIQFNYKKKKDESVESYIVLVIDPSKEHESSGNEQLHGLLIEDYDDNEILALAAFIGKNFQYDEEGDDRRTPLASLDNDAAYEKFLRYYGEDRDLVYRTFLPERMSMVRQILLGVAE